MRLLKCRKTRISKCDGYWSLDRLSYNHKLGLYAQLPCVNYWTCQDAKKAAVRWKAEEEED